MNKIFYGDIQPNHKEHKIWINSKGVIKTYNNRKDKWVELTNDSVPEEPEKPTSLYEFVDLGLPSGTLWATTNVGAEKPEDYGSYFAWGETQGYEGITTDRQFTWGEYKFGTNDSLTKYNEADGLTMLKLEDDVAYQSDNTCRMPTKADFKELISNTTSIQETLNGVNGVRFTSKINSNSIFFPAAGYCNEGQFEEAGSSGGYWSSLFEEMSRFNAWFLCFYPNEGTDPLYVDVNGDHRCYGKNVRAVKSIN